MWRIPASGGNPVKVLDGVVQWGFTVIDKGIYHIGNVSGDLVLKYFAFDTGKSTILARNLGNVRNIPDRFA